MIGPGEDEEGRGGDVKRMGKRRKVRLWVCRGNGERRRERGEERGEERMMGGVLMV